MHCVIARHTGPGSVAVEVLHGQPNDVVKVVGKITSWALMAHVVTAQTVTVRSTFYNFNVTLLPCIIIISHLFQSAAYLA